VTEIILAAGALLAGAALGVFYFGGLWLTVRGLLDVQRRGLILAASFVVRTGVVLAAFYWITGRGWLCLIAAVAGFLIARHLLVRWLGRQTTRA